MQEEGKKVSHTMTMMLASGIASHLGFLLLLLNQAPLGSTGVVNGENSFFNLLHHRMTREELSLSFGVTDVKLVDKELYQVVRLRHEVEQPTEKRALGQNRLIRDETESFVSLEAFGKAYRMKLVKNRQLLATFADAVIVQEDGSEKPVNLTNHDHCHYQIDDPQVRGGISFCNNKFHGSFKDQSLVLDIVPLDARLHQFLPEAESDDPAQYHIVKVAKNGTTSEEEEPIDEPIKISDDLAKTKIGPGMEKRSSGGELFIETAVFMDCAAHNIFKAHAKNFGPYDMIDLTLMLINGIQGIYNYPSLGRKVNFNILHVKIENKCSIDTAGGERNQMLTNFCSHQMDVKKKESRHWDIALLFSGVNMYGLDHKKRPSWATMGLSTVTGICDDQFGCVIGEIGVRSESNEPYPSTGWNSLYVMAHEIGHNLGMPHDSEGNDCDRDGHLMSPTKGSAGEADWSTCSAQVIQALNLPCLNDPAAKVVAEHQNYQHQVGATVTAAEQCHFLTDDLDATVDLNGGDLSQICHSLKCQSNKRPGSWVSGPAIDGTRCGSGRVCKAGQCIHQSQLRSSLFINDQLHQPRWDDWVTSKCTSGCIEGSIPVEISTRKCITDDVACPGAAKKVKACEAASNKCSTTYNSPEQFASEMCGKFIEIVPGLGRQLTTSGLMMPFNNKYPERSCLIHCQTNDGQAYSPLMEVSKFDLTGQFPDGTRCREDKEWYCLNGVCQSASSRSSRTQETMPVIPKLNMADPKGDSKPVDPFFISDPDGSPMVKTGPKGDEEVPFEFELDPKAL